MALQFFFLISVPLEHGVPKAFISVPHETLKNGKAGARGGYSVGDSEPER